MLNNFCFTDQQFMICKIISYFRAFFVIKNNVNRLEFT